MASRQKEMIAFWRRLGIMIRSGVPILEALSASAEECQNEQLRTLINNLRLSIENGNDFTTSLARHPELFSPSILAIVRTGERTGRLEYVCEDIAQGLEKKVFNLAGSSPQSPQTTDANSAPCRNSERPTIRPRRAE